MRVARPYLRLGAARNLRRVFLLYCRLAGRYLCEGYRAGRRGLLYIQDRRQDTTSAWSLKNPLTVFGEPRDYGVKFRVDFQRRWLTRAWRRRDRQAPLVPGYGNTRNFQGIEELRK